MRKRQIISLFILLVFAWLAANAAPGIARAQDSQPATGAEWEFGERIIFTARIETPSTIQSALVVFQASTDTRTHIKTADIIPLDEKDAYELKYVHEMSDYALRPFSTIQYHFEVTLQGQDNKTEEIEIKGQDFTYDDKRFEWQYRQEGSFHAYWTEGDVKFGQAILDTAQAGMEKLQNLLPYPLPDPLYIVVYPNASSLQEALSPYSPSWVAGHADPDLGMVIVALPRGPDQYLLMEQRIPHELMHIALFQETGKSYASLPTWLNEGLASQAEMYENPDYRILLEHAVKNDSLLPMSALCNGFPLDASNALLAYAQADSFTEFLYNSYGKTGLQKLVDAYTNGLDCEHGAKTALGKSLSQLERQWHIEALSKNAARAAFNQLLPWFVLLAAVLIAPLGLGIRKLRH